MSQNHPLIFTALDTTDIDRACHLAAQMAAAECGIKLGLEFFNAFGPQGVQTVMEKAGAAPLFLDLKYHDIPNTVAGAVRAAGALKPAYMNVHASGGFEMMQAARDACPPETKLLAVTVLTSLDKRALEQTGQKGPAAEQVVRLAELTQHAGLDGIVCSPLEIRAVRATCGDNFALMVPGIRPDTDSKQDQKRVTTPRDALEMGATHLVIGRPITQAGDPQAAAKAILEDIAGAKPNQPAKTG